MTKAEIESQNMDIIANFLVSADVMQIIAEHQKEFEAWEKREGVKYENRT